jgi:hypothetical protein
MKHTTNVTLSLPSGLISRLHRSLPKRKISRFTTDVLTKALDELEQKQETALENGYAKAFSDEARKSESKDWAECDEYKIENWDWYDE